MRKEVLFAILFGGIIGAVVAFGLWRANKALQEKRSPQEFTQSTAPRTDDSKKSSGSLTITAPENNSVVSESKIRVEGKSSSEATIVISTQNKETIVEADKSGLFSEEIELDGGANLIKVVSFDKDGNKEDLELAIVYSTELE